MTISYFKKKCLLSLFEPSNLEDFKNKQEIPHEESENFLHYFKN